MTQPDNTSLEARLPVSSPHPHPAEGVRLMQELDVILGPLGGRTHLTEEQRRMADGQIAPVVPVHEQAMRESDDYIRFIGHTTALPVVNPHPKKS